MSRLSEFWFVLLVLRTQSRPRVCVLVRGLRTAHVLYYSDGGAAATTTVVLLLLLLRVEPRLVCPRPKVHFKCPTAARLLVEAQVLFSNGARLDDGLLSALALHRFLPR